MAGVVRTIATKLSLEGESEYKTKMAGVNDELKTLGSQLKLVESEYKNNANSLEALTAKGDIIQKQYEAQTQKLELLTARLGLANDAQERSAAVGRDLAESIAAQKEVIAEYETALKASKDGTVKLYDSNGQLIQSYKDGAGEVKKLKTELTTMERSLESNEKEQQKASSTANYYQREINNTKTQINNLDSQLKENKKYTAEATAATDKCATSIDNLGKQTKDTTEKSGLLEKIFAGGFLANIATQALNAVLSTLKQLATEAFTAADELSKLSSETGQTTDELQELQYAGDELGVQTDTVTGALKRLINNMESAKSGSGDARDAFESLGVSYKDNVTGALLDSNTVFANIIDALHNVTNETERDALAQDLLGKSATELNPIIEAGSAALGNLAEEAHSANAVMGEETVAALDTAGDRMSHWWQTLTATMGEAIVSTGNWLAGNTEAAGKSIDTLESLGDNIKDIESAYESATFAAKKSLDEQIGMWDDLSGSVGTSFSKIKQNVESQNTWYENYSVNLENLMQRHVDGIDKLVASLSDGTAESAKTVAGLATASDEELQGLISRMGEVETRKIGLSRQLAEVKTDTSSQLNTIYGQIRDAAASGLNAQDEAINAAKSTVSGYISGTREMIPILEAQYRTMAERANAAYLDALEIHSPSRVAMRSAENYWKGNILATQQMQPKMESVYAETAAKASAAANAATPAVYEPGTATSNTSAISAAISTGLSGALSSTSGSGYTIKPGTVVIQIDGRQVATATYDYTVELTALKGTSLINEVT